VPNAWQERAPELAEWALARYFVRTDRFGGYYQDSGGSTLIATMPGPGPKEGAVNLKLIERHFRGSRTNSIIGAHTLNTDNMGSYCAVEVDAHEGMEIVPDNNERFALAIDAELRKLGFKPLTYESNGKGGYHVLAFFSSQIKGITLFRFARWLARDFEKFGFDKSPETFPKQAKIEKDKYGNWLRIVGRHHTREFWPRVWDGKEWIADQQAVDYVLSLKGNDPELIDPFRQFNLRSTADSVGEMLKAARWTATGERGDRFDFRRPDKDKSQSGNIRVIDGVPIFYPFTNSTTLEPGKGLNPSQLRAKLEFNDDFSKLADVLWEEVFGAAQGRGNGRLKHIEAPELINQSNFGRNGKPPVEKKEPEPRPASRFKFIDAVDFLAGDYTPQWLVPQILVRGQPCVIAAPSKGMKTSILLDLAVSLSTGMPFLDRFPLREQFRVAVASGESGEHTIKETILRIMRSKGLDRFPEREYLKLEFNLPTFTDAVLMTDFAGHLARLNTDVVVIDPTYLAMGDVDAKNLFEMGEALRKMSDCLKRLRPDLTVILVHHANRLLPIGEVMELQHLAYSGLEQYARQFFLLNRRELYKSNGIHDLWFRVGGSAGHGGLWSLHIEEGMVDEDWSGRQWKITVQNPSEVKQADTSLKDQAKRDKFANTLVQEENAVMAVIDKEIESGNRGATLTRIREHACMGWNKVKEVVKRLEERGVIEEGDLVANRGLSDVMSVIGYIRASGNNRADN
jgi:AAA domain